MKPLGFASAALIAAGLAGQALPGRAWAGADLFSPETIRAWADMRLVSADGEKTWLDDGFGKLRYGGERRLDAAQVAVQWKPRLTDTLSAYVVAQSVSGAEHPAGIEEAYLKWRPLPVITPAGVYHSTFRAGQMFPPVSMEHDGVGWTPSRTLTPSAINSWIGEEVLVEGVEAAVTTQAGDHTLGATVGVFSKDDTAGTILSWRGWALHDISSAENTELPLPAGPQGYKRIFGAYQAYDSKPYDEVDTRLGYYARLDWRPPAAVAFNLEFYDNLGDPNAVRNAQWGWATRFWNLGAQYTLSDRDTLISQYMIGGTHMGFPINANNLYAIAVNFDSAYLMLTHDLSPGGDGQDRDGMGARLSARVDYFGAKDLSWKGIDDNTDKGYALTVAWLRPLTAHVDFALEGVRVWSVHPARVTLMLDPHQAQTQLQMAFKLHL